MREPTIRMFQTTIQRRSTTIYYTLTVPNLNGTAMPQPLLIYGFRWLQRNDIDVLDVYALRGGYETGYILEVDLQNPQHLHQTTCFNLTVTE